jgi:hypothetical protein
MTPTARRVFLDIKVHSSSDISLEGNILRFVGVLGLIAPQCYGRLLFLYFFLLRLVLCCHEAILGEVAYFLLTAWLLILFKKWLNTVVRRCFYT